MKRILLSIIISILFIIPLNSSQEYARFSFVQGITTYRNTIIGSNIILQATATDDVGVSYVEFQQNSNPIFRDPIPPYETNWIPLLTGIINVRAIAVDAAGNIGYSNIIEYTVANPIISQTELTQILDKLSSITAMSSYANCDQRLTVRCPANSLIIGPIVIEK